jgi:hypothetical protein
VNFTSRSPEITLVHSSSMTAPFGLTDKQLFEKRADRPELFLDRSLEFSPAGVAARRTRARSRAYQRKATISSMTQTWSASPASIAGVTRSV